MIPILTHYSDIVSGISSGSVYGICILTSENLSGIYSGIHSCILSGIYSDSLSGILSGILSGLLYGMSSGPGALHSIRGSPHGSDSFMSTVPPRRQRTEAEEEVEEEEGEGEESQEGGEEGGEEGEQGITLLLKSRDPYLASGKPNQIQQWQPAKHHNIKPSIYHIPIEKYQQSTIN